MFNLQVDEEVEFETCNHFCHALWQEDKTANGTEITILSQGEYKIQFVINLHININRIKLYVIVLHID